jgi:hypothetical protein
MTTGNLGEDSLALAQHLPNAVSASATQIVVMQRLHIVVPLVFTREVLNWLSGSLLAAAFPASHFGSRANVGRLSPILRLTQLPVELPYIQLAAFKADGLPFPCGRNKEELYKLL